MTSFKKSLFILSFALATLLSSCMKERSEGAEFIGKDVTLKSEIEQTKVSLLDDGYTFVWSEGDVVAVFDGQSLSKYVSTSAGAQTVLNSETGIADGSKFLWAIYPYSACSECAPTSVYLTVPSVQNIAGKGLSKEACLSVAYTEKLRQQTSVTFNNICSFFNLNVPASDRIVRVDIQGEEGEMIAGKVKVKMSKSGVPETEILEGVNRITLTSSTPIEGNCVIALLPTVFQNGFSVTLRSEDGRVASHKVIAVDSESGIETAVTFNRGRLNHRSLSIEDPSWKNPPVAECIYLSATSATIRWSENEFSNPEADFAGKYEVVLYSDKECTEIQQKVEWSVSAIANVNCPAFCFTGLQPLTDYYAMVKDVRTDAESQILKICTSAADFIAVGESIVSEGEVAFKEDFSCVSMGGDPVHVAWGIKDGALTAKPDALVIWNEADLKDNRLSLWEENNAGHNYIGPGYIRVGDSSAQKDAVKTPVLSNLKESATATVEFKAAPFSSDYGVGGGSKLGECYAEVWVVDGSSRVSAGVVELNDDPTSWTSCSLKVYNVLSTSRIAIGGAYGEKTKTSSGKQYARIYLDDIKITVDKYEHVDIAIPAEVELKSTFWSDALIQWSCAGNPESYTVTVDGQTFASLAASATEYHIKGLEPGKSYSVAVAANYKYESAQSNQITLKTGSISQLTKNVSPTSVSVAIENMAGDNTNNNNPCIQIQLYDGPDIQSANLIRSSYILDAQIQSPASPFFGGLVVDNKKSRAPLNVALGSLQPSTAYWVRVRSVARYDFMSYSSTTAASSYCESSNGDSEFSTLIKVSTCASHTPAAGEVIYLGFDELMIQADYVNCAVGSVPAFKAAGKKVTDLTLDAIKNWTWDWSYYGQRTAYGSTQLAPQYAWGTQQTTSNDMFTLASQLVSGDAPGVGAKIYKFKDWTGSLSGWISSNNTYPCQGCIQLGYYYDVNDAKKQLLGMLVSPALDGGVLGETASDCLLSFNALVLQGRTCNLGIWVFDSSSKLWTKVATESLYNSAGTTTAATEWSAASSSHKWYNHSVELKLKKGDCVAFDTDKEGAALIDEILILKL